MDISSINYEPWKAVRLIGNGSFGSVYEIQREEFGEIYKAALKVITIPKSEDEIRDNRAEGMDEKSMTSYYSSVVQELTHEFSMLSKLAGNTNVVSYADHKVVPHANGIGWDIYIRMELLTSLPEISSKYSFSREEVIKLGIDICNALILCEKNNIIHRDIKPDNIFVSDNGDFKLGDFGIARTASKTMSNMTKRGTLNYMAPEVSKNEPYNQTVDIYSLGIVLYQLMNNKRLPFMPANMTARDRETSLGRRMSGEELPIPEAADQDFARIILRACAYDPNQRYGDAEAMKNDLLRLLNGSLPKALDMPRIMALVVDGQNSYGTNGLGLADGSSSFSRNQSFMNYQNANNTINDGQNNANNGGQNNANNAANGGNVQNGNNAPTGNKMKMPLIFGGAVAAVLIIVIMVVALSSGGKKDDAVAQKTVEESAEVEETMKEESDEAELTEEEEPEEKPEADETAEVSSDELPDDLNEFIFQLEGYTYKLPIAYQDFKDTGWELYSYSGDQTEETEIASNQNEYIRMTNGAVDIDLQVYNASGNVKTIKECNIGEITIEASDNLDFVIAKGITCASTDEEVQEAFGTPSSSNEHDDYKTIKYSKGDYRAEGETYFYFDKTHSANNTITITYMPVTTDDITEVDTGTPEYLAEYKAPKKVSKKATEAIFELDGKVYQLPCPFSEFLDDGWSITSKDEDSVGAQNKGAFVRIGKDGYELYVNLANYDKSARTLENCAVYRVEFDTNYKSTDMPGDYVVFSGGLNLGTDYTEADNKLGDFEKDDSDDYIYYRWESQDYSASLRYSWSKDVDYKYMDVTIDNENWDY